MFSQRSSIVDVWQNFIYDSVWRGFHHWGYTRESWTPPASWLFCFTPNTNAIRRNLGLTPRPHFLEGDHIHWVDKAKYVWLIVGQLPIKAGRWDAPLALRDFSQSNTLNDFLNFNFSLKVTIDMALASSLEKTGSDMLFLIHTWKNYQCQFRFQTFTVRYYILILSNTFFTKTFATCFLVVTCIKNWYSSTVKSTKRSL